MKKNLLALLILVSLNSQAKAPDEFEDLTQGVEERVEVVLSGKKIGPFDATVSPETVRFTHPDQLIAALELPLPPGNADYEAILHALSAPLDRNEILACHDAFVQTGCGYLKTDNVAVIYDSEESRVTLFLRDDWMPVNGRQSLYLSADKNDVENALIHEQDLNMLAQADYSSLYLQNSDALGVTENSYIGADWSLTAAKSDDSSDNSADISNLYYRYDIDRRYYLQLGRMDNRTLFSNRGGNFSFSFLPLGAIDGIRAGSTLSYVNHERVSQGTPVTVLLSQNSRVDAYRNNQLLGSFYLPAGNQSLDTAQFPDGSYTLNLYIYEGNQLMRVDTTSFAKTGGMDDGRLHWFIQGGKISDDNNDSGENSAYQAGVRIPLFNMLSLTAGGALARGVRAAEGGVDVTPDFGAAGRPDVSVNVYRDAQGGHGDSQQLTWTAQGLPSLSLYRYASGDAGCDSGNNGNGAYTQLGCLKNLNASLTTSVSGWNTVLSFLRTENYAATRSWQSTNSFTDNVLNQTTGNAVSRTWQLSASRAWNREAWTISGTFGVFSRDDSGYAHRDNGMYLSLSFNKNPQADEHNRSQSTRFSADYRNGKGSDTQSSYRVSHSWYWDEKDHKELSVEAGGINSDTVDTALSGRYNGRYGNLNATLSDSYDRRSNSHNSALSGAYSSSFALSRHGLNWGGAGVNEPAAAVLVDVAGGDDGDEAQSGVALEARVGGNSPVSMSAGGTALFPLMPYESGLIDISDGRSAEQGATTTVLSGAGSSHVMLLPGKLRVRQVAAEQRFGYIGRLLLPPQARKYPIIGLNSRMLILTEDGGFTAQLTGQPRMLYLLSGQHYYRCPLKVQKRRAVVRYVGEVQCLVVAEDGLPKAVRDGELAGLKRRNALETAYGGKGK
ncbi:TcfC E-set like domain-containing protein [Enterobacillus tribolii]|uniref:TcfC/CooC/PapC-like putative outer membrane usher protein in CS1 pili formation n=1 Tax=Enterobacillus tribolii TaxID=1487935 RepID=A0A370R3J0_9GAMM|nr:TcfC E-set like domain-containing protein [Enterobacillus tribolii]MBW7984057.1 hypothetical protein [Enterobacillus tribolii]RDK96998.1 TcfC/CooC/PapC-like putative outer membrane usher protein in CS1 pili formation [Enterobacillus tribolii]